MKTLFVATLVASVGVANADSVPPKDSAPAPLEGTEAKMGAVYSCTNAFAKRFASSAALPQDIADGSWGNCASQVEALWKNVAPTMGVENAGRFVDTLRGKNHDFVISVVLEQRYSRAK